MVNLKSENKQYTMGNNIRVKKRNGKLEEFDVNKINKFVERVCENIDGVSPSEVVLDMKTSFYDKIQTTEIDKGLELTARQKIYKEPNYSYVAARVVLSSLYKEILKESVDSDTFESDYRSIFVKNIKRGVKNGILSDKLLKFDLKELSEYLVPSRDDSFKYVGIRNIADRYLLKMNGKVFETPQAYYMRIAMGICINEENFQEKVKETYDCYSKHLASPSTPTLFNSGTIHNQLSSCYLSEIDDSVDGIFDGLWQEARKSKYAGGLGFHVSGIRAQGSHIKGTNGTSSGLIPWLKVYNDMLIACDQAGKRQGSGCAYIEPWHYDIYDFIDLKKTTGEERRRCHDLNTALWTNDLFFERIREDGQWTLFCPSEVSDLIDLFGSEFESRYVEYEKLAAEGKIAQFKTVSAKSLWKKILKSLFETSHPWITYKDNANLRYSNIHEGTLHGSNLCTEIFLHTKHSEYKDGVKTSIGETAVCNLASINLSRHVVDGKIDYDLLRNTISILIRMLDNVIDINFYPTEEARKSNMRHRPIGMGTMGWSDLYMQLEIVQDSDDGIKIADELMEFISMNAIYNSSLLAKERGKYTSYDGSTWSKNEFPIDTWNRLMDFKQNGDLKSTERLDEWRNVREHVSKYGMRNSNVMAIAPNASIAYQMGCEQSIEPMYRATFRYENMSGNCIIVNFHLVDALKRRGLWTYELAEQLKQHDGDVKLMNIPDDLKQMYKIAFDRDMNKLIAATASRQKWMDQGISFNIYNNRTSLKYLNDIYIKCAEYGLKSTYYFRNIPASKIQNVTSDAVNSVSQEAIDEFSNKLKAAKLISEQGGVCEMCEG
jgi:ribonucleoside-diphosphate reductase alpha chain